MNDTEFKNKDSANSYTHVAISKLEAKQKQFDEIMTVFSCIN